MLKYNIKYTQCGFKKGGHDPLRRLHSEIINTFTIYIVKLDLYK